MSPERAPVAPPGAAFPEPDVSDLERHLGVSFADRSIARQALIHKSLTNDYGRPGIDSNERLEFLGDAVVGEAIADLLYRKFPANDEGQLTLLRASLVRASTLARWARELHLGDLIQLGRGEHRTGGRDRDPLLASCFEAVVGAVYLDQGREAAFDLVQGFARDETAGWDGAPVLDAKSQLQQTSQAHYGVTPSYEVIEHTGPQHSPTFTIRVTAGLGVQAIGTGGSKQAAQQAAATAALAMLGETDAAPQTADTQEDGATP
ncbi:MAG: ribonuclease III [Chloroflexota bacterium]